MDYIFTEKNHIYIQPPIESIKKFSKSKDLIWLERQELLLLRKVFTLHVKFLESKSSGNGEEAFTFRIKER